MRRDKRPFVVEVRRAGAKKTAAEPATKRKLKALASPPADDPPRPAAPVEAVISDPPKSAGRILPSLVEPPPPEIIAEPEPTRRRGRPPGSKNKPKFNFESSSAPPTGKRRGRPPKNRPDAPSFIDWANSPAEEIENVADTVEFDEVEAAMPVAMAESASRPSGRKRRVSTILNRYVFGASSRRGDRRKRNRANP